MGAGPSIPIKPYSAVAPPFPRSLWEGGDQGFKRPWLYRERVKPCWSIEPTLSQKTRQGWGNHLETAERLGQPPVVPKAGSSPVFQTVSE